MNITKLIQWLTICKPTFQFILGLLSVNSVYILVMWKNGTENPPTISVGGFFVYSPTFSLPWTSLSPYISALS